MKTAKYATGKEPRERVDRWRNTALRVLDTLVKLQLPDGNLGNTYRADRQEILDPHGFAAAWFIPALAMAYEHTRDRKYLDAGVKALNFYGTFVRDLNCFATPMDAPKFIEQEGNLGYVRGAVALCDVTDSKEFAPAATDSANYEYLWRYGFRARPQFNPLKDSPWNSCGGSITSAAHMIHPMGVYVAPALSRVGEMTDDTYHHDRAEDGLDWGTQSVELYPKYTGYGVRGVLTERWCPSDGMTIETFPDGSPSSLWFSYNGWAAAAVLEGLVENVG